MTEKTAEPIHTVRGPRYRFTVCIDDDIRYLSIAHQLDPEPLIKEIQEMLRPYTSIHQPKPLKAKALRVTW